MGIDRNTGLKLLIPVILGGGAVIVTLVTGQARARRDGIDSAIRLAQEDMRRINQAFQQWEIECKTPMFPMEDIGIPYVLNEYFERIPTDPFSRSGERYKYLCPPEGDYAQTYALVSCGPDEDWDLLTSNNLTEVRRLMKIPPDAVRIRSGMADGYMWDNYREEDEKEFNEYQDWDIDYVELKDGTLVHNTPLKVVLLPSSENKKDPFRTPEQFSACLIQIGVSPYDPTNGIVSNGDLMYVANARGKDGKLIH